MRTVFSRAGLIAASTTLALGLAACGSDSDAPDAGPGPVATPATEQQGESGSGADSTIDAGEGDYTFGLRRDSIAETMETTFSAKNAEAAWEGDTLVLTLDGDASEDGAGDMPCRVIKEMTNEGDSGAVVFPNGRIDCED